MILRRNKYLRELSRRLDGQLSPGRARALDRRLASDARLTAEEISLRKLDQLLQQWPEPAPLPEAQSLAMRRAILRRVQEDLARGATGRAALTWIPRARVAAWALSGMMAGLFLLSGLVNHIQTALDTERFVQDVQISMMLPFESPFGQPFLLAESMEDIRP